MRERKCNCKFGHKRGPMIQDIADSVASTEPFVDTELDTTAEQKSADKALSMLRNAARVGTPAKVKSTIQTIVALCPVDVLETIRTPLETAQSFVFARTGNSVDITR